MKFFQRKAIAVLFLMLLTLLLPLSPLGATRERISWQPQKIAVLPPNADFAISPDEKLLAVATYEKRSLLRLLTLTGGREIGRFRSQREISALTFSDDGKTLAWASIATTEHEMTNSTHRTGVALWDMKGKPRYLEMAREDLVYDRPQQLRFSPDGKTLWMASSDNLRAWDMGSGKLKWQWRKDDMGRGSSFGFSSAISKDCQLYFRCDEDGYTVWDVKTMKRLLRTELPFSSEAGPQFSTDMNLAAFEGYDFRNRKEFVYPIINARTARVLWRSWGQSPITIVGDKAIRQQTAKTEVLNARDGKLLRTLPVIPESYVLPVASHNWLYSIDRNHQTLYRQRLQ